MGEIGDPYATVEQLEARLGRADDGTFAAVVGAASRLIELFTGRQFNRDEVVSPRRFRAVDPQRVAVDDFWTVDDMAVEVDGDAWDVDQVDPRPWDGIVAGQPGWPFFDLFSVGRRWPARSGRRRAVVTLTVRWGWEFVPQAIPLATLDVASDVASGLASGSLRAEQLGDYSRSFGALDVDIGAIVAGNPAAFLRAAPYMRRSPWGIG